MTVPFVLESPLGGGGYGDLYLGRLIKTGERVVVKLLRNGERPSARRFFKREVRILGRGFRGVIPVLHAEVEGPNPWYVMPYLPGGSLTQYAGKLSDAQLLAVAIQLTTALGALHGAGIAHGDVKPDNSLVDNRGHVHIADPLGGGFGCTLRLGENRGGTRGYWAPEVANGGSISAIADIYSLGATLCHLATGNVPVDGMRVDLAIERCELSMVLKDFILASTASDPAARATINDLKRILNGERWPTIQGERRQIANIVTGVAVIGGAVLIAHGLAALLAKPRTK